MAESNLEMRSAHSRPDPERLCANLFAFARTLRARNRQIGKNHTVGFLDKSVKETWRPVLLPPVRIVSA
jgi:hypothetical protein